MTVIIDGTNGITTPSPDGDVVVGGEIVANDISSSGNAEAAKFVPTGNVTAGNGMYLPAANTLAFSTNGSERVRVDSSGKVLVGITSSQGDAGIQGAADAVTAGYLGITTSTAGRTHFRFINSNGEVGSISTSGLATSYNTSSDYRLKENVAPMQNALDTVTQLNPVTWSWKASGEAGQGFIAHELQAVCPDAVSGEKDAVDEEGNPVYQGVDTSFLVATLTAAIQELNAKVESLQAQLEAK